MLSYWTDPDGTVAIQWGREMRSPVVQMVGGSDVLQLVDHPARRRRISETLLQADLVVTVGSALAQRVTELGVPPDRVTVLRRGVDRSRFGPGSQVDARQTLSLPLDRPILLWVGRMVPVKGLEVLLSALSNPALTEVAPLQLLVGGGPELRNIQRLGGRLIEADRLRLIGRIPSDELAVWYRAADLVVLPSHSEGIPNVLLEALACGTGFVASNVGGIPEISSDPAAELVPPGDAIRLAERIADRLRNPLAVTTEIADISVGAAIVLAAIERVEN